ncbi:hypothetical protein OOZ15_18855 [Galbibacter sp. EGI 63066]|uniref:hypothetical protein n=1 Tax=Galbibacter sp. EGI 63066 TaxID=2993559 RepID=UPI002248C03A|nr:hypothetical protein [Galbibacter sp. EGI 63066]MCX2682019.1 hypothetical protein [Galbibacter sp. EGI 63066]
MRIFLSVLILSVLTSTSIFAQSKKELRAQVSELNSKLKVLRQTEADLAIAERKVENLELRLKELQQTNSDLMENMNKFLSASTQQSNTVNLTLETLERKEAQIKDIRDTFSANDSIAFLVLTDLKKTLGEDAQIGVEKGSIIIAMDTPFLYGSDPNSTDVEETAKGFIGKIATVAKKYPSLDVTVESRGANWNLNASRAASVANVLQTDFSVASGKLKSTTTAGASDASFIRLHVNFNAFYLEVREDLKKGS